MAMIGYFDESGTHGEESPIVTIAGFIASANQWSSYQDDLSQLLTEYKVKVFHARKFRTSKGDFKGWPMPRRAQFNSHFLKLADDHLALDPSGWVFEVPCDEGFVMCFVANLDGDEACISLLVTEMGGAAEGVDRAVEALLRGSSQIAELHVAR